VKRWPALVLIPGLLVAALLFDQRADTERARRARSAAPGSVAESSDLTLSMAVGSPADALSSAWFCAGGTSNPGGIADHAVVVSNPTATPAVGSITAVPSEGRSVSRALRLAPYTRQRITLSELVKAPFVAAEVDFQGGQVAVEHEVSGPDGIDAAPCASSASTQWYFASGATTRNAQETLVLFNPFPDAASVDITFATPDGTRTPTLYQGFLVPGRSVVATTINTQVAVDSQVSTSVVARAGRIVVDRIQLYDGNTATTTAADAAKEPYKPKGLTIALGVPRPQLRWMFPVGVKDNGLHERFVVYNPSKRDANVDVGATLVDPKVNGEIDPLSVTVPAGTYQVVDLDGEDRVPTRVDHSTVVRSTNGVAVVVDRLLDGVAPYAARGTATSSGTPLVSKRWIFASGGNVPNKLSERISVQNPSSSPVTVRLQVVADGKIFTVKGVGPVTLGPHEHQVLRFGAALDNRQVSVVVSATAPIAAERLLFRLGDQGMSTAVGIPLPDALALVPAGAR